MGVPTTLMISLSLLDYKQIIMMIFDRSNFEFWRRLDNVAMFAPRQCKLTSFTGLTRSPYHDDISYFNSTRNRVYLLIAYLDVLS